MRKRSYGSVTVFWLDREEARRRIAVVARQLVNDRSDLRSVHLFGSLAEDRAVPGSDADLLLVLRESRKRWMDRPLEFLPRFEGLGIPVELFCYTEEELAEVPLARRAVEEGILLVGDPAP